jgi:hypothetical protein
VENLSQARRPVEALVLLEYHGVVVADGRLQESLGVAGRARVHDLETRRVEEGHLHVLGVEGPTAIPTTDGPPDHQRKRPSATVVRGRDVVRDDVVRRGDEVHELHLDHGTKAHVGRPGGRTREASLRDGRVDHTPFPEGLEEAAGDLEGPAVGADVLAHQEDPLIRLHLLEEGFGNGLQQGHRLPAPGLGHVLGLRNVHAVAQECVGRGGERRVHGVSTVRSV